MPHLFAETPIKVTHHHDEDDSDEEADSSLNSPRAAKAAEMEEG